MNSQVFDPLFSKLTDAQRVVLASFSFDFVVKTKKELVEECRLSYSTVHRALKKLVELGALECVQPEKKGRGYSNIYRLV